MAFFFAGSTFLGWVPGIQNFSKKMDKKPDQNVYRNGRGFPLSRTDAFRTLQQGHIDEKETQLYIWRVLWLLR